MKKRYSLLIFLAFIYASSLVMAQGVKTNTRENNSARSIANNVYKYRLPFFLPAEIVQPYSENEVAGITGNHQQGMLVPTTGTDYDVKYYRLELRINPDTAIGKYIKGKVTTYFTTTQSNFSIIKFDKAQALKYDSVYYHGVKMLAANIDTLTTDIIKITIPNLPAIGTLDSVSIYYKGVPPNVPGFSNGTGYVKSTHGAAKNYVYTLSEPYSSYTWWPCKSFIASDKADSMDMIVTTPLNFRSAGNGTRVYEVTTATDVITYWKERYPIAAYQVCTAVANYVQYPIIPDTVTLSGTKMPVYNLIFPETNTAGAQTSLNRIPLMITTYSALFGDYPFKNEKYGNYSFGFGGGMEHNTFSGESNTGVYTNAAYWDVLAHELAHQWWGANVTCGSWQDIWVNESFADFSEALVLEFAPSIGVTAGDNALSWRTTKKTNTIGATAQATHVTDTSTILTIFTPSVYIYDRGGMIITMLRALMGDTKFFQGLKNYQSDPLCKMGSGFTADIKRNLEAASGLDLTTFFNQWIYNTGYATYAGAQWNNTGKNIVLKLPQVTQSSALPHFDMPVIARITGSTPATMDTTVIVYDQAGILYYDQNGVLTTTGSNLINFHLSFTPTKVAFDSLNQMIATGAFAKNPALPVTVLATHVITFNGVKDGNTAKLSWGIENALDYASFEIERSADGIAFEHIATIKATDFPGKNNFTFTDNNILTGTGYYRIKILQKDGAVSFTSIVTIINKAPDHFTIFPNPASDYIIVQGLETNESLHIKIYDLTGRLMKQQFVQQPVLNGRNVKIAINDLKAGSYLIEILSPSREKLSRQVIKIK
jgi:aminopeptidase N